MADERIAPFLERAFMFLEDGEWQKADEYCEKVLDIEPKNAEAYLGKLMVECRVKNREDLKKLAQPFDRSVNYQKAIRFDEGTLRAELEDCIKLINSRNNFNRLNGIYETATQKMQTATSEKHFKEAAALFANILQFKDSASKNVFCIEKAEEIRKDGILNSAKSKMTGDKVGQYEDAIRSLETIRGWKDSDEQIAECKKKIEEIKAKDEAERIKRERRAELKKIEREKSRKQFKKSFLKIVIACASFLVSSTLLVAFLILLFTVIIPSGQYKKATEFYNSGDYMQAAELFGKAYDYKDSQERYKDASYENANELYNGGDYMQAAEWFAEAGDYKDSKEKYKDASYKNATELYNGGDRVNAAIWFGKAGNYADASEKSMALWSEFAVRETVYADGSLALGVRADGTVVSSGYGSNAKVDLWVDIIAVAAGDRHSIGLQSDGTVVATEYVDDPDSEYDDYEGQCDVKEWSDIVAVAAAVNHSVGLKTDGTVVAVGNNDFGQCDVKEWTDIVAVAAGDDYTVGLKADGTVVAAGDLYRTKGVENWTDIVAVSAGDWHIVGLKADGTVVASGSDYHGKCDVGEWTDIVAVSTGEDYTVGLKADGTVVATEYIVDPDSKYDRYCGQCDVEKWTDIIAVSAGDECTVGLKADGTVIATEYIDDPDDEYDDYQSQYDVDEWTDIVAVATGRYYTVGLKADGTVVVAEYSYF